MSMKLTGHRLSIACPHCNAKARVRTSREETALVREAHLQCSNIECGHTFVAKLEITRTISPPLQPNPDIRLPLAKVRDKAPRPQNDNSGPAVPQGPPAQVGTGAL